MISKLRSNPGIQIIVRVGSAKPIYSTNRLHTSKRIHTSFYGKLVTIVYLQYDIMLPYYRVPNKRPPLIFFQKVFQPPPPPALVKTPALIKFSTL